jgi:hypothetical protein
MMFAPVDLWRGYDIVTLKGGAGMFEGLVIGLLFFIACAVAKMINP